MLKFIIEFVLHLNRHQIPMIKNEKNESLIPFTKINYKNYKKIFTTLRFIIKEMCQFVIADCWWHNCCGVICGGWYHAACCCSAWLCMPYHMTQIDPDCCKVGCCVGYGYNHCCWGNVCCITDSFRTYSGVVTMGSDVMSVNSGQPMQPFNQGYGQYWEKVLIWLIIYFLLIFILLSENNIFYHRANKLVE